METTYLYGGILDEILWMEIPNGYGDFVKGTNNKKIVNPTPCLLLA
jgi:hypothetical protein